MKLIFTLTTLLFGFTFLTGCRTQVAIDPLTGQEQTALFQAGFFFAPIEGNLNDAFKETIKVLDEMGYFRTGERHEKTAVNIYARKVGDEKVLVRLKQMSDEGNLEVRIRIGHLGNLAESQTIYARIIDAL